MTDDDKRSPRRVDTKSRKRLLDDFFKVDEHIVSFEQIDGTMSPDRRILVFERGDAAAALLYDPSQRMVILVNQFRLPTLGKGGSLGWITETAAGIVAKEVPEETPEECIIREIEEETGYQVTRLTPVANFFSSPGGSSELIHLFYAEVRATDKVQSGGGTEQDGEDIRIEEYPLNLFLQMLANREFTDPKVIIAGQWLRDRQNRTSRPARPNRPTEYNVAGAPGKTVGFISGDILDVHGVDIWVNPENTDMIMDRFFGRSMSATIRFHGAQKVPGTLRVDKDTIGEALRNEMGRRTFVKPAFVLQTTAGELAKPPHQVQRIFHVATVQGQIGERVTTDIKTLEECVTNVLAEIELASNWPHGRRVEPYRSVIFPMLGTGEGGLFVNEVAEHLVARAISFFQKRPGAHLRKILFLAFSEGDEAVLLDVMETLQDKGLLDAVEKPGRQAR